MGGVEEKRQRGAVRAFNAAGIFYESNRLAKAQFLDFFMKASGRAERGNRKNIVRHWIYLIKE